MPRPLMTIEHRPVQPTAVPSGGRSAPTEESRAFLQERLALFAKVAFVLSSGFFAFASVVANHYPAALPWIGTRPLDHLVANVVLLVTWLACVRGTHPIGRLRALEAGSVFVYCLCMAASVADVPSGHPGAKYSMLLALTSVLIGRAVLVPGTATRTLGLSTACVLPALAGSWIFDHAHSASRVDATVNTLWAVMWCLDAVAVSAVASHVIYGLRERMKEAVRLGQYTLEQKLGSGGMGEVYKASHAFLKRPAAVKLLRPENVGEPTLRRFEREVQLTSRLTHPNTIAVFDYGRTASGIFYYAMEYLEGIDLDDLVRAHGPQPPARVVHVLRQVCGALAEAHELGLIHRDVKPANIILCQRGGHDDVAKVVDFGLVKDLHSRDAVELTAADAIAGTPLYLSPEAVTGVEGVGPESDLYALGAVGYFLVTGRPPFEGTLIEVCSHHVHSPAEPPSARLGRSVPAQLEGVLLRCLEKDPKRRPASASELAAELGACADVGEWTQASASAWWREHGQASARVAARRETSAATLTRPGVLKEPGPVASHRRHGWREPHGQPGH